MKDDSTPKPFADWSKKDIKYLKQHYGITNIVEFAKKLRRRSSKDSAA